MPDRDLAAIPPSGSQVFTDHVANGSGSSDLDLLFVVDNSGSMTNKQNGLALALPAFMASLRTIPDLDLRVGITTTDLGVFGYPIADCSGDGDAGRLRDGSHAEACGDGKGFNGRWLYQTADGRTNALDGDVDGAFACVARVGSGGCGFEMPLGAVQRALGGGPYGTLGDNAGFLRDDSILAVVVVTDEDDCTAVDRSFLDPNDPSFGAVTSFRCTANGVECESPSDISATGAHEGCSPGGTRELEPGLIVPFLHSLRPGHPEKVVMAVIAGPSEPFRVGVDLEGGPVLMASCEAAFGDAAPAIRLEAAAAQMGNGGLFAPICQGDFTPAVEAIADLIVRRFASRCLTMRPADLLPDTPGLQPSCSVVADGVPVARCGTDDVVRSCYRVVDDPSCPSGVALEVDAGEAEVACVGP